MLHTWQLLMATGKSGHCLFLDYHRPEIQISPVLRYSACNYEARNYCTVRCQATQDQRCGAETDYEEI